MAKKISDLGCQNYNSPNLGIMPESSNKDLFVSIFSDCACVQFGLASNEETRAPFDTASNQPRSIEAKKYDDAPSQQPQENVATQSNLNGLVVIDCPHSTNDSRFDRVQISHCAELRGAHLVIMTSSELLDAEVGALPENNSDEIRVPREEIHLRSISDFLDFSCKSAESLSQNDIVVLQNTTDLVKKLVDKLEILSPRRHSSNFPKVESIRRIIKQRRQRSHLFGWDDFVDPAWEMLLDLTAARLEEKIISTKSLSIASGIALTTALRWISRLEDSGLIERMDDKFDGRRTLVKITDKAFRSMMRYFSSLHCEEDANF